MDGEDLVIALVFFLEGETWGSCWRKVTTSESATLLAEIEMSA